MYKPEATAIPTSDIVVNMQRVTKTFAQSQRSGQGRHILRNLLHPEKRTITALDGIDLQVRRGEFVAYAGANGAGKSTTLKLLSGMLVPNHGCIEVLGMSPQRQRIPLMRRVGVLFGTRTELWWDHPIRASFEWKRVVWDIPADVFARTRDLVVELLDIGDLLHTFARELSLGQRMRCDLALMLLHQPEVIFLDEPTLGLDVLAKRQMIQFLKTVNREQQTTIIVTSHDMDDLEEMAQRIILLSKGKLAFDGSFDQLRVQAGGLARLILVMDSGMAPRLRWGQLIRSEQGVFEYEIDTQAVSMKTILAEVAEVPGLVDLELRRAPLESTLAELFHRWRQDVSDCGTGR